MPVSYTHLDVYKRQVLAEDTDGRMVNVEMQVSEDEDHQRRARYYQASMDMSFLEKGCPYEELPELYLIFITEKDFLNQKTGICYIDRVVRSRGTVTDNGVDVYKRQGLGFAIDLGLELIRLLVDEKTSLEVKDAIQYA